MNNSERPGFNNRYPNHQERWQARHENWNQWHNNHYHHHSNWYHGYWHGGYYPGGAWNYWWDNYPAMTAFGVTTWAINRVGWAFGYYNYVNPYYTAPVVVDNSVYNYSQPIVMTPTETTFAADPTSPAPPAQVSSQAMSTFETAQSQFYDGNYNGALNSVNAALKEMPNDTVIHEFRALVLFSLGNYKEAAATLYAVLSVGPGWDWTTMSGLYPSVNVYTDQLRKLEAYVKSNPNDPAGRFVLAYHYITCTHTESAVSQLKALLKLVPDDQLAAQLLIQLDPSAEVPQPKMTKPPEAVKNLSEKQLIGDWVAKRGRDETFEMILDDDGTFTWKYTVGGNTQTVRGVYALDEENVLALEMGDEGVLLAKTDVNGKKLDFYMLGDTRGAEPLHFVMN